MTVQATARVELHEASPGEFEAVFHQQEVLEVGALGGQAVRQAVKDRRRLSAKDRCVIDGRGRLGASCGEDHEQQDWKPTHAARVSPGPFKVLGALLKDAHRNG